jgi:protein O-GlcNAc transferase
VPTPEQTIELALEMSRQGKPDAAAAQLRRFLQRHPNHWPVVVVLGQVLLQSGHAEQALFEFQRCLAAAPKMPACHNNVGMALSALKRSDEALRAFRESVHLDPGYAKGWLGLSMALLGVPDYREAAAAARRAIELAPSMGEAYHNLGLSLLESGQVEEAIATMRRGIERTPWHSVMHSTMLIATNYRGGLSPAQLRETHETFARLHPPTPGIRAARTDPNPDRRLRIGVLSADTRTHSVMFFLEPLLEHHDRGQVEVFCYAVNRDADETTARLKRHGVRWIDASVPDDGALDRLIRRDQIDILIEFGGHSAGNRLLALKDKPAPVLVTAIGYPNTTGMPAIDYRLVDSLTDPAGSDDAATETLLRLDPCFLCYRPPQSPEPDPPPSASGAPPTFGSFNSLQKLSEETLAVWGRVMERVPGSRLALKTAGLNDAWAREVLTARLERAGISPDRVDLLASTKGIAEHLSLYARMDVALDPFPYNGTTTTCEALWMGVPVVALAGDRHAARVGVTLLRAIGREDLVAPSADEYIRIASSLAMDTARLTSLRASLRGAVAASVLCDGPAYARRFEAAMRGIWHQWCAAQKQ